MDLERKVQCSAVKRASRLTFVYFMVTYSFFVHSLDSPLCTSHSHHQGLQRFNLLYSSLLLPQVTVMIININEFCEPGKIVMVRKLSRGIALPLVLSFFFSMFCCHPAHFFPRVVSVHQVLLWFRHILQGSFHFEQVG